jgi:adenosylmethionine-8-amino-7-oxononanoate aminotransferase
MVDELAGLTGFNVGHTFNANPICCAAGVAVIDEVVDHDLMGNAERMGERLRAGLEGLKQRSPLIGDVRGRGLLNAIELVADRDTNATFGPDVDPGNLLRVNATRHGILLYARRQNGGLFGDWSVIAPPLIVTEAEVDEIVERLGRTVDDTAAELLG